MLRSRLLSSVSIRAFAPGEMVIPPDIRRGAPDTSRARQLSLLVAAGEAAAGQFETSIAPEDDLSVRDNASSLMFPYWQLTDDIVAGYDAVRNQGTAYLPKFGDEEQADYDTRLGLTKFTNVYRDSVETLAGKPFEEEITIVEDTEGTEKKLVPDDIKEFAEDVDGAGSNINNFAQSVFFNGVNSALHWIWVDYPVTDTTRVRTIAEAKAENIRPFWSHVLARNVLEAKAEVIGGKETLVRMRILEPGTPNHIRMFQRLDDGQVVWSLWQEVISQDGRSKTFKLVQNGFITIGVIPLVPFTTGRRDGRTYRFFPAMQDAADLQIQLYQQESGLKFIKTMSAYPMLAANGMAPEMDTDGKTPKKLRIGPSRVLYAKPAGNGQVGSWEYVVPPAEILKFLKEDIKETMDQLRELGKQPLTAQSGNLTVITTAVAASKAKTAVQAWCWNLKDALENALRITCMWLNIKDTQYDPEIKIFDDFDDYASDQNADMSALQFARSNKDLSHPQYIRELKRRGTISPEMDEAKNDQELLDETPSDAAEENEESAGQSGANNQVA